MNTATIRAFIAVEIDEIVRRKLSEIVLEFEKTKCDVKWVKTENFHLTLIFLGDIIQETVDSLKDILRKAVSTFQPFKIEIKGMGTFGHPKYPRVIWAGIEPNDSIQSLYRAVKTEVTTLKLSVDEKEYIPHLTIGRVRSGRGIPKLMDMIKLYKTQFFGSSTVDSIVLMKSVLQPSGPVYSVLHKVSFGSGENAL